MIVAHKYFDWDPDKNVWLLEHRQIRFEDVLPILEGKEALATIPHPNKKKFPNQKVYVIELRNYVYVIPFVEDEEKIFLKTIYPSRKANRIYKKKS